MVRVHEVETVAERVLRVTFSDGLVRELDFAGCRRGVFAALAEDAVFNAVRVDKVAGTITFPGGIDFDPDVLHGDEVASSPEQPRVVREYTVERSG